MRHFANLFLLLFATDASISLLDELLRFVSLGSALDGVRGIVAITVIILTIPLYIALGIDQRLPKRILLPLILFALSCPLVTMLYPPLIDSRTFTILMSLTQLLLCLPPYLQIRKLGGRFLRLPREMFSKPFFRLRNTLLFGGVNLALSPLALLLVAVAIVNAYLYVSTAGFMRIGPTGIQMTEKVYQHGEKSIRLVGMIHVGERGFYDRLVSSVSTGRTVILAEGVTDDRRMLTNSFSYRNVAGVLGLTSQETMRFKGRHVEDGEEEPPANDKEGPLPDIVSADLDMSSFTPTTIRFINELGKQLHDASSAMDGLLAFNGWASRNITPQMQETIRNDILHRRNLSVIRHLDRNIDRYDTIVIPWGALHMPEIEQAIIKRGFTVTEQQERLSVSFVRLFSKRDKEGKGEHTVNPPK